MRYLSLFSGIEAATAAWHGLGWTPVAFAEIEPFPCAVLAHHYPGVPNLGDVTKITEAQIRALGPIDLVVFGSPCQDVSVAGKREGLKGKRSGLFFDAMRVVRWSRAEWVVFENVPGLTSSHHGQDFSAVLDEFEDAGYVIDVDILDAQFFGVPQRRRRIFICGQRVDNLLNQRTTSSGLTIAQCLAETLHLGLGVLSGQSMLGLKGLGFDGANACLSLQKRMRLFSLAKEGQAQILLENLAAIPLSLECERSESVSSHGKNSLADLRTFAATKPARSVGERTGTHEESQSTVSLLNSTLAESLRILSRCTISISASEITQSTIYTCALVLLNITRLIGQSDQSSPSYWTAALSGSTAIKEFIDYARWTSSSLFTDPEWIQPWANFIAEAEDSLMPLGDLGDREHPDEVLPFAESLCGNHSQGGEARKDVAPTISARTKGGGGLGTDFDCDGGLIASTGGVSHCLNAGGMHRIDYETETLIAHSLRAEGFDASEDGTGRGIPLVASTLKSNNGGGSFGSDPSETFIPLAFSCKDHGSDAGDVAPTLRSMNFDKSHANAGGQVAIAFDLRNGTESPTSMPVQSGGVGDERGGCPNALPHTLSQSGVRRLTPVECERLMGLPDGYTNVPYRGKKAADGHRYKSLGNSMAAPCLAWIGRRIDAVHRMQLERAA